MLLLNLFDREAAGESCVTADAAISCSFESFLVTD